MLLNLYIPVRKNKVKCLLHTNQNNLWQMEKSAKFRKQQLEGPKENVDEH